MAEDWYFTFCYSRPCEFGDDLTTLIESFVITDGKDGHFFLPGNARKYWTMSLREDGDLVRSMLRKARLHHEKS